MTSGEEDARLVRRSRDGDREAFELLVRRHLAAAHRVALVTTGDRHDADDVCQDAFVKALIRIEDCRQPERFRAWLLTIVKNTALNALDREKRRRGEPLDEGWKIASEGGPEADAERRALRERLAGAVQELPEMQRRVLLLHDYEGWTHGEIGEELGIAAGTSRYHLHAARGSMRRMLERRPDDGTHSEETR
ncbi:MAG: RNA polymerase sigma factor [Gemmatimonadota bacterium]